MTKIEVAASRDGSRSVGALLFLLSLASLHAEPSGLVASNFAATVFRHTNVHARVITLVTTNVTESHVVHYEIDGRDYHVTNSTVLALVGTEPAKAGTPNPPLPAALNPNLNLNPNLFRKSLSAAPLAPVSQDFTNDYSGTPPSAPWLETPFTYECVTGQEPALDVPTGWFTGIKLNISFLQESNRCYLISYSTNCIDWTPLSSICKIDAPQPTTFIMPIYNCPSAQSNNIVIMTEPFIVGYKLTSHY